MSPLALMAILAGLYSSFQSHRTDAFYSDLIENQIKPSITLIWRAPSFRRFGFDLYNLIAEPDSESVAIMQYSTPPIPSTKRKSRWPGIRPPSRSAEITSAEAKFDQAALDSRAAAAWWNAGQVQRPPWRLMRSTVNPELQQTTDQVIRVADDLQSLVDQRSAELTRRTKQSILITWLVIGVGLLFTFALASYVLHVDVVQELFSLRDSNPWPPATWTKPFLS